MIDEFVSTYSALRNKPTAPSRSIAEVKKWLQTHDKAIDPDEASFVDGHDDIIPVVAGDRSPLRRVIEDLDVFGHSTFFQRKMRRSDQPLSEQFDLGRTIYRSDKKIDGFVNAVICIVGFFMLTAPLWILLYVPSKQHQLIVITIFIAAFLAIVQSVSVARPFESLAATAASVSSTHQESS